MSEPSLNSTPTRPLRILHVLSALQGVGGAEQMVKWICEAQIRCGSQVLIVNPFDQSAGDLDRHFGTIPYKSADFSNLRAVWQSPKYLIRCAKAFDPDIIHAHLFHASGLVAWSRRELRPSKIVLTHHYGDRYRQDATDSGSALRSRVYRLLERPICWRHDACVAISQSVYRYLRGLLRGFGPPIYLVHNGLPLKNVRPVVASSTCSVIAVAVGSLTKRKGHDILLRALAYASRSSGPHIQLRIIGDGPERIRLQRLAESLGIAEHVDFIGHLSDPWEAAADADIAVQPSRSEPFGLVAVEALQMGLPLIATRVGGLVDIVRDGRDGLLVAPESPQELATALVRLARDVALRRRLSANARQRSKEFDVALTVENYYRVYAAVREGGLAELSYGT